MRVSRLKSPVLVIVGVLVLMNFASLVFAGDAEVLVGLEGVQVVVEYLPPEIERDGLYRSTLKTAVELKLRRFGIKVLTESERLKTINNSCLYVNVQILKQSNGAYFYYAQLELKELVIPLFKAAIDCENSVPIYAITFKVAGYLGTTPNLSDIKETTQEITDEFINAYLSVNPR